MTHVLQQQYMPQGQAAAPTVTSTVSYIVRTQAPRPTRDLYAQGYQLNVALRDLYAWVLSATLSDRCCVWHAQMSNARLRPLAASWLRQLDSDKHPMANPLPAAVVAELLRDGEFQPGPRPRAFSDPDQFYIFKEHLGHRTAVYGKQQDRWHNSGGSWFTLKSRFFHRKS